MYLQRRKLCRIHFAECFRKGMMEQKMEQENLQGKERRRNVLQEIWEHPLYAEAYRQLQEAEQGRKFCCHSAEHFLDVARIAYIQNLEEGLGIRREVLYAAALLHDIGKALQYKERIPHEIASAEIAGTILNDLGDEFSKEEKAAILQAIRGHRSSRNGQTDLERLLYESDKKSRLCFICPAEAECNWEQAKKNMEVDR